MIHTVKGRGEGGGERVSEGKEVVEREKEIAKERGRGRERKRERERWGKRGSGQEGERE